MSKKTNNELLKTISKLEDELQTLKDDINSDVEVYGSDTKRAATKKDIALAEARINDAIKVFRKDTEMKIDTIMDTRYIRNVKKLSDREKSLTDMQEDIKTLQSRIRTTRHIYVGIIIVSLILGYFVL